MKLQLILAIATALSAFAAPVPEENASIAKRTPSNAKALVAKAAQIGQYNGWHKGSGGGNSKRAPSNGEALFAKDAKVGEYNGWFKGLTSSGGNGKRTPSNGETLVAKDA